MHSVANKYLNVIDLVTIVPQLNKCQQFKFYSGGDKNDCTLYKITLQNTIHIRHLPSFGTIDHTSKVNKVIKTMLGMLIV